MKKRLIALFLGMILVVGLLSACGGGNSAPAGSGSGAAAPAGGGGDANTLTIAVLSANQPGLDQVIADFEAAHPGVTVEPEYISDLGAYITNVPTRLTAGTSTDIVQLIAGSSGTISVIPNAEAGNILDLSDQPWVDDIYEDAKELFLYDGKTYAMDFGYCPLACLVINEDLFAENNLEPPKTFDELLNCVDKFNEAGIIPIAYAGGEVLVNSNDICVMIGNEVVSEDPEWFDKMLAKETTFADTPGAVKAVEMFKQLYDADAFSPGCAAITQAEMISSFASGEAAMIFTYGGNAGMILEEDPSLNISVIPFPGTTADKNRIMVQASGGLVIANTCANPDLAKEFLAFMREPEEQTKFAEGASCISVSQIKDGTTEGIYAGLAGTPFIGDFTAEWPNTTVGLVWGSDIQGLLTGQKTVDDVVAAFDTYFNQ